MSEETAHVLINLMFISWYFAVMGTCTYIVFWLGHSGWWYVLAFVLCASVSISTKEGK